MADAVHGVVKSRGPHGQTEVLRFEIRRGSEQADASTAFDAVLQLFNQNRLNVVDALEMCMQIGMRLGTLAGK